MTNVSRAVITRSSALAHLYCSTRVEPRGFEPLTPTLPVWCATSCATAPRAYRGRHPGNITHHSHRGRIGIPGYSPTLLTAHQKARTSKIKRSVEARVSGIEGHRRVHAALTAQHHGPQVIGPLGECVRG